MAHVCNEDMGKDSAPASAKAGAVKMAGLVPEFGAQRGLVIVAPLETTVAVLTRVELPESPMISRELFRQR